MSAEEKQISFYNRYFIFRKNRNINAKQLKSSFLSYAGLQEEQHLASSAQAGEADSDITLETIALEKIAKASRPIDVASKPAIAARILEERQNKEASASASASGEAKSSSSTMKIKPKPKKLTVKASASAAEAEAEAEAPVEAPAAPIEQIEKKIQKRTKKVKATESSSSSSGMGAGPAESTEAPPAKPKRQTKKKTDL
jgi:hypothetical protein